MIILLFVIFVTLTIICFSVLRYAWDDNAIGVGIVSLFVAVGALIGAILIGIEVSHLTVIDDRIEMYQEENAVIEQQIADVVEQYQKYETDIFMEVAPESAVSMVALYPELKSDSLVQAQIEVYVANNNMIKDLKDQQIKGDVYRWWLYFGGGRD